MSWNYVRCFHFILTGGIFLVAKKKKKVTSSENRVNDASQEPDINSSFVARP